MKTVPCCATIGSNYAAKPWCNPLRDGDVEGTNKSWSKWTPSGQLSITITNPDAIDAFEKGNAYYLDFTPVHASVNEG